MVRFKHLQLGKEVTTLVFNLLVALLSIFLCHNLGFSLPCHAVPSQHGWISWAKLAWFGMLQLEMIPVYTEKIRVLYHAILNHTVPSC